MDRGCGATQAAVAELARQKRRSHSGIELRGATGGTVATSPAVPQHGPHRELDTQILLADSSNQAAQAVPVEGLVSDPLLFRDRKDRWGC